MDQLYYSPGAASMLVHWMLLELDAPHTLHLVDTATGEQKSPAYLAINPNGVVPTWVHDGRPMFEAAAIAVVLADGDPRRALAPAFDHPSRRDYMQWMFHLANAVQPLFRLWWYPHEPAGEEQAEQVRLHVAPRIEAAWDLIDAHLDGRDFLVGGTPTVADFYLTMLMRWSRAMPRPATDWPRLAALARTMTSRVSFAQLCEREGLGQWP